jgi:four helix bundle protein
MEHFKKLIAYQKAFELAINIFTISKRFPKEELFSLTNQIRRSSRSVCSNFAEAYRRRKYAKHFISKLSDCDAENMETGVWLDFSLAFSYITDSEYHQLYSLKEEVGRLIGDMINNPQKYS